MQSLNIQFKTYPFRLKKQEGKEFIFDVIRKRFMPLTPEEWVRQNIIHYLLEEKKISRSLLAIEKQLNLNGLSKRTDIVVYNNSGLPQMIIECKAPSVKITQAVCNQAARYNLTLRVKYLLLTNGNTHYCCEVDWEKESVQFIDNLPF